MLGLADVRLGSQQSVKPVQRCSGALHEVDHVADQLQRVHDHAQVQRQRDKAAERELSPGNQIAPEADGQRQ
ncbi:hypothetical protein D3C71_1331960 [compost metagenome]